jgi:two-component system OmpR family sensor kinase
VNDGEEKWRIGPDTPRRGRSLQWRLAAGAVASIVAAVVLLAVATVLVVDHELRASLDGALRQQAEAVAQLAVSAPAVLTDPGALESPVSSRQELVEVLDAHGGIVARSLSLGGEVLPLDRLVREVIATGDTAAQDIILAGHPLRLFAAPIADAGGPASGGAVLVASSTSDITHTTSRLTLLVILIGAGVVLFAALAAAWLTRRSLAPLRRLADAAGEIERTGDPARRLPVSLREDEIGRLTGVLNRMLASLELSRASERRLLADASHELRTPVTALLGNAEYAARHGGDAEVLGELRDDAARLARLVDSLLMLERAGAGPAALQPVDLRALAEEVIDASDSARVTLRDETARAGAAGPPIAIGDPEALRRALANLVENALIHGPPGGAVTVWLRRSGPGGIALAVSDAGPGPDPGARDHLFERFWRGEGAAERPGSGLGLSIVSAIAERHGGRVEVEGATFTLRLALADGSASGPAHGAGGPAR